MSKRRHLKSKVPMKNWRVLAQRRKAIDVGDGRDKGARRDLTGLRISVVVIGAFMGLPGYIVGAQLDHEFGTGRATLATLIAGVIIGLIGMVAGVVGARTRQTSYELISDAFGKTGGKVVNVAMSITMLGWFAVVCVVFGQAAAQMTSHLFTIPSQIWVVVGAVLVIATAAAGFAPVKLLATITTPLKVLLLLATICVALSKFRNHAAPLNFLSPNAPGLDQAVSMVVGSFMLGALLIPDVTRMAANVRQAAIGGFCAFAFGAPIILSLAGFAARLTGQQDVVGLMVGLGLGLPAMLILIIGAWSSNSYNLYAMTLVLDAVRPTRQARLAVLAGSLGLIAALAGLANYLGPYLMMLGIAIPPISAVYVATHIERSLFGRLAVPERDWNWAAFASFGVGVALPLILLGTGRTFSTIPAVDGLVASVLMFALLALIRRGRPERRLATVG
jgi:cytosine permease